MITADQLKDIQERAEALHRYLDIDRKRVELEEEELRTQAPDFWDDPARAQEQMKKVKGIEKWIVGYKEVRQAADELQLAFDFYHDEMVTEEEVDEDYRKAITAIENLELMNMLRQKEDPMDCVLKINSGAGGKESQDWAQMLMRMYMRWAEAHGHRVTISNLQEGFLHRPLILRDRKYQSNGDPSTHAPPHHGNKGTSRIGANLAQDGLCRNIDSQGTP